MQQSEEMGVGSQSEILFNVKQCEELFQKDKSDKMLADITKFKNSIVDAKRNELNYYRSIRLSKEEKHRIFQVEGEEIYRQNNKIIVWDPLQGNLIMTEEEYNQLYKGSKK